MLASELIDCKKIVLKNLFKINIQFNAYPKYFSVDEFALGGFSPPKCEELVSLTQFSTELNGRLNAINTWIFFIGFNMVREVTLTYRM